MNSREKVLNAINFKEGQMPKDLGAMASTAISAFAYPELVKSLGLKPRKPKVYDIFQMLSLVDMDVLDALGCDAVSIVDGVTNAFDEPEKWKEFDFNGRLDALVRENKVFTIDKEGTVFCPELEAKMPASSTVFDQDHGGQVLDFSSDLPKPDLGEFEKRLIRLYPTEEQIAIEADLCRRVRQATDKAIMYTGYVSAGIGLGASAVGGIGVFPMVCLLEPDYVASLHSLITEYSLRKIESIVPLIKDNVDILMFSSDDWGTQNALIAPPRVYENLFLPYLKKMICRIKELAPDMKVFLHSCGNIIEIIPFIIEAGYDILNPVQWSTTGAGSYKKWKQAAGGKLALWGGGVDSQHTLPLGSANEVAAEAREVSAAMSEGGGYIFNNIHNFLADTDPEKIVAMYKVAGR